MPRTELFKIHNVAERIGYKIIKEETMRRGQGVHNQDRKRILGSHECDAIEALENANFYYASLSHSTNAKLVGLASSHEHSIQRNVADYGVGIYRVLQKKINQQVKRST